MLSCGAITVMLFRVLPLIRARYLLVAYSVQLHWRLIFVRFSCAAQVSLPIKIYHFFDFI